MMVIGKPIPVHGMQRNAPGFEDEVQRLHTQLQVRLVGQAHQDPGLNASLRAQAEAGGQ